MDIYKNIVVDYCNGVASLTVLCYIYRVKQRTIFRYIDKVLRYSDKGLYNNFKGKKVRG